MTLRVRAASARTLPRASRSSWLNVSGMATPRWVGSELAVDPHADQVFVCAVDDDTDESNTVHIWHALVDALVNQLDLVQAQPIPGDGERDSYLVRFLPEHQIDSCSDVSINLTLCCRRCVHFSTSFRWKRLCYLYHCFRKFAIYKYALTG